MPKTARGGRGKAPAQAGGPGKSGAPLRHQPETRGQVARRIIMLVIGTFLVGIGLEIFLVPNQIIDGGVVGLAIIGAHLTPLPLPALLVLLNLPFLWLGYRQIGRTFAITTLWAVLLMAGWVALFHPVAVLTDDLLLAAVFGGVILGLGVGIVIRYGGSLDGTEIVAIMAAPRLPFSVGEIVMFFNIFILGSAGLVFGWDRAMYSLIAYFIAFRAIDLAIQGLDESKSAMIVTTRPDPLAAAIMSRLGRGITFLAGKGGWTGEEKGVLFCVVTRLEVAKLKSIVREIDPGAFMTIEDVHEVLGGRFIKKAIH